MELSRQSIGREQGAGCKYDVMDTGDICKLPVKNIAADDCVLFMWVTMPKLNECFDLIKAWGFEYKTCAFVWIKQNRKADSLFMGMGRWTRANAEICLLGTKGNPKRDSASVNSVIVSHIEEHSKKPAETRRRIEKLMGGGMTKIELFARQSVSDWDCWGNEVSETPEEISQKRFEEEKELTLFDFMDYI